MFNLAAIMDAIAVQLLTVTDRAYAWPVPDANVPCAVVGYPTNIDFDMTMGRGADEATFPVFFLVGATVDLAARDALSVIINGASGIKEALDGTLGGVVDSARVTDCKVEIVNVGAIPFLSAVFTLEVVA